LLEALCFTGGVSICSNNRVTFRNIHEARFGGHAHADSPRNAAKSDAETVHGYCLVHAVALQISVRTKPEAGLPTLHGKQCMSGVDRPAPMRHHAPNLHLGAPQSGDFRREMRNEETTD
jgi:hypothetical protein